MNSFGQKKMANKVLELIEEMKQKNMKRTVKTYTILLKAYLKSMEFKEAENVLNLMKEENISPNHITFAQLLFAFVNSGRFAKAEEILHLMRKNKIVANEVVYLALIKGNKLFLIKNIFFV